jgi:hypothetical protein
MHVGMSLTLNVSVYTNNTSHNLIFMPQNDHIYIYIYIYTNLYSKLCRNNSGRRTRAFLLNESSLVFLLKNKIKKKKKKKSIVFLTLNF